MAFITNYIQNTAMSYLTTGLTAAGGMAGNAVGGVGTMIEQGGRSIGDSVEGFFNKGGNLVNGYGDRIVGATATQNGPVGKQPIKALDKKPAPSSVPKQANGYTKTALPSASSKVKGLPAPPAGAAKVASTPKALSKTPATPYVDPFKAAPAAGGKVKVSAASRPKPAGVSAVGSTASKATTALPKTPLPGVPAVGSTVSKATPSVDPFKSAPAAGGKVKVSAASRPKPAGVPAVGSTANRATGALSSGVPAVGSTASRAAGGLSSGVPAVGSTLGSTASTAAGGLSSGVPAVGSTLGSSASRATGGLSSGVPAVGSTLGSTASRATGGLAKPPPGPGLPKINSPAPGSFF